VGNRILGISVTPFGVQRTAGFLACLAVLDQELFPLKDPTILR
jgi:hypothetical protein